MSKQLVNDFQGEFADKIPQLRSLGRYIFTDLNDEKAFLAENRGITFTFFSKFSRRS